MPAGAVGTVWASGRWSATAWEANAWANVVTYTFIPAWAIASNKAVGARIQT